MSTAKTNQLLIALALCGNWPPAIRTLLLVLGFGGHSVTQINIRASAETTSFSYPLCGDDTDK